MPSNSINCHFVTHFDLPKNHTMATNLPSCFSIESLEQLLKFLVNFTLLKYGKSQRSYGFLITKELIFSFQILGLKDHFSASLKPDIRDKHDFVYYPLLKEASIHINLICSDCNFNHSTHQCGGGPYFHTKLQDVARKQNANLELCENIFVFV